MLAATAIAVALMPPLCVVGLCLSQSNLYFAKGAFLLYITNLLGITLACMIIFILAGYNQVNRTLGWTVALTGLILLPLGASFLKLVKQAQLEMDISDKLANETILVGEKVHHTKIDVDWTKSPPIIYVHLQTEKKIHPSEVSSVTKLVKVLMRFSMLLGGYGKSWRRADHRLFNESYYNGRQTKPLIGCHWHWRDKSLDIMNVFTNPKWVSKFLDDVQVAAKEWMQLAGITSKPNQSAGWREAWHKNNVQVWGRVAEDKEDSKAIDWFHGAYRPAIREINQAEASIYRTDLTGSMKQISRIWHRMYPLASKLRNPEPNKPKYKYRPNPQYLELLTIFPDDSRNCTEFLDFLKSNQSRFSQFW